MNTDDIYNCIKVNEEILTGGQPTADQLRSLPKKGFTTVINLATASSTGALADEAGLVGELGMDYFHIPVEWDSPQESDFTAFEQVMLHLPPGKTLIHCVANFRVTAFYSLYAQAHLGWTAGQAEEFRAPIWERSDYPVWKAFIDRMTGIISTG
jgi:protein tyrosine phosphatase (PTP) superfamily phosphohydrolase (DUF442 family)